MRRGAAVWISVAISAIVGICCAQLAARSVAFRDKLGTICGRGHLLALVHGHGIYQADVDRTVNESHYRAGAEHNEGTNAERQAALTDLIANVAVRTRADREMVPRADLKREMNLLRSQFRDDKTWSQVLGRSGFLTLSLWRMLGNDLRAGQWLSKQIAPEFEATEAECRDYYDSHPNTFFVTAIQALSVRLVAGEDFAALTAENSEDEATKLGGGDLGYFSATRMPPDFVEAALKLHPGEISKPIRTRLGFHILKSIDVQQARQKTFDEARNDIAIRLANQKRATALQQLIVDLSSQARYLTPL
jgi:hypothetical protein